MKTNIIYCLVGVVLCFMRVEGAFERAKPIQGERIASLLKKTSYDPEEIKNYDLNEIYIAGALLSEGWGSSQAQDEKKALLLYQAALEVLRKDPMDVSVAEKEFDALKEQEERHGDMPSSPFLDMFKTEFDTFRRPFVASAIVGDTIWLMLRQCQHEEALKLMDENRRRTLFKNYKNFLVGAENPEKTNAAEAPEPDQVTRFYECMLSYMADDGYLLIESSLYNNRRWKSTNAREQALRVAHCNLLVGNLVVSGFEQRTTDERLKAFPFVLRNAKMGIPQAMVAMHLYYKYGCDFLPPDENLADSWLRKVNYMKRDYPTSEEDEEGLDH